MKIKPTILVAFIFSIILSNTLFAQDVIVTSDLRSIKVKVLEINDQEVKYKDFDNLEGPIYIIKKTEINLIVYQNGKVESFKPTIQNTNQSPSNPENINEKTNNQNSSQNLPKLLTYDELMKMNDYEKASYLSTIGVNPIYDQFQNGNKMTNNARSLRAFGFLTSIAGGILYTSSLTGIDISNVNKEFYNIIGATVFTVGQVLIVVSIPISIVGGTKKLTAENMYKDFSMGKSFSYIQPKLNFGLTQNGIGLSFIF